MEENWTETQIERENERLGGVIATTLEKEFGLKERHRPSLYLFLVSKMHVTALQHVLLMAAGICCRYQEPASGHGAPETYTGTFEPPTAKKMLGSETVSVRELWTFLWKKAERKRTSTILRRSLWQTV